jgi:hypothetical protein
MHPVSSFLSRLCFSTTNLALAHFPSFILLIRYIDLLTMRGELHTAQKSLIDVCSRYSALKVPEYIEMSRVSRGSQTSLYLDSALVIEGSMLIESEVFVIE